MLSINYVKLKKAVLLLSFFFTIISQMPFLRDKLGIDTQSVAYPMWIMMILVSFISSPKIKIEEILFPIVILAIFIVAVFLFELISDNEYLTSVLVMPIIISFVMMIIGYLNADILSIDLVKRLATVYVFATLLVCLDIYIEYFQGYDFSTVTYVYKSKNSVGQLILTALVLILFLLKKKGIKWIIRFGVIAFLLFVIACLRSRASMVSLVLIPIMYVFSSNVNKKNKILVICASIVTALMIIFNDTLYNYIIRNLILNTADKRLISLSDINRISSHRYQYFETFATLFRGNELIGIGSYYMDNFYMEVILNYGVLIGLLIIALALFPLKVAFASKNSNTNFVLVIRIIALSYTFNGIFEGVAPFGPGAKCFFLWLMLGAMLNQSGSLGNRRDELKVDFEGGLIDGYTNIFIISPYEQRRI